MELKRHKEIVEAFHFDKKNPEVEAETELKVGFAPLTSSDPDYPKENSIIGVRLEFKVVFEEFLLSGAVSQVNHFINQKIDSQDDLSQEEADKLVAPLFDIVKRMTYEITEIALDQPGVELNFQSQKKPE
ncbi:hypothetical protein BAU15_11040 [Enterococcus sp. JM4C]|uniref:DUF1149 family protein n=1 Tax=Candidatus Enterococcus huntleyi TaxID=1857217 RepID=UPI00137A0234|nr:DUF1149 family protein [Enterococcus sp. JM4C]KAF1298653.1 hypothetical protein BAU15_11040 [Enterococcus sp. JM4C]